MKTLRLILIIMALVLCASCVTTNNLTDKYKSCQVLDVRQNDQIQNGYAFIILVYDYEKGEIYSVLSNRVYAPGDCFKLNE